jgi:hypothetical protein
MIKKYRYVIEMRHTPFHDDDDDDDDARERSFNHR